MHNIYKLAEKFNGMNLDNDSQYNVNEFLLNRIIMIEQEMKEIKNDVVKMDDRVSKCEEKLNGNIFHREEYNNDMYEKEECCEKSIVSRINKIENYLYYARQSLDR